MNIKPIDFSYLIKVIGDSAEIVFVKPGKVFRVYPLDEIYNQLANAPDIKNILDRTCSYKCAGLWIFLPTDTDMINAALHYLYELSVPAFQLEENKIPEILN